MLSDGLDMSRAKEAFDARLNAPYGARCFLTTLLPLAQETLARDGSLNAPYGARCFLTNKRIAVAMKIQCVLMHLMALGAF